MRILFVSNDFSGFGGMQQVTRDFLNAAGLVSDLDIVMCRGLSLLSKGLFAWRVFCRAFAYRPQFIIYNHINYAPIALALFGLMKIPYAFIVYGVDVWEIKSSIKIRAIHLAHSIISCSHFTRSIVEKQMRVSSSKFFVIEPTLDTDRFFVRSDNEIAALRASQGLSGRKVILYVGRLSKKDQYKGYDKVVKALPIVLRSVPEAMYIVLGDGDDRERVEKLAAECGVRDKVSFAGALGDEKKVEYYQSADVFIMPSTREGFGIVYLEALSCGTPVVAGNLDASSEPLLEGQLGTLVDPGDTEQIAQSLTLVLRGGAPPSIYNKEYLHRQVAEHFGREAFQKKVSHYIHTVEHGLQE